MVPQKRLDPGAELGVAPARLIEESTPVVLAELDRLEEQLFDAGVALGIL